MFDTKLKPSIICPKCGKIVNLSFGLTSKYHYVCPECQWDSLENTVDILYADDETSALSNMFPHEFLLYTRLNPGVADDTHCLSMESFLQSLRIKDPELQKYVCEHCSGPMVHKLKVFFGDWREDGYLYWNGVAIKRDSQAYIDLITTAYDCLFEGNPVFRECVLPSFKGKYLIHSIGKDNPAETLLTESEFRYQLNRLMQRLDYKATDED